MTIDSIRNRAERVRRDPSGARLPAEDVLYLLDLVDHLSARLERIAKVTREDDTYERANDALFKSERSLASE